MKETKKKKFIDANRRGFMQGAAATGAVAATGVASTTAQANELDEVTRASKTPFHFI